MPGPIAGSSAACQSRDGAAKKAGADHTERGVGVVQAERVVVLDLSLHRTPCFFAGPHLISTILKPPEPRVSREGVCVRLVRKNCPNSPGTLVRASRPRRQRQKHALVVKVLLSTCPRMAIARKQSPLSPPTVIARCPLATREPRGVEPAPRFGLTLRRAMRRASADERWCDCFFLTPSFPFLPLVWCLVRAGQGLGPHKPVTF